jgi:diguanylate cyclase (GGDEF)-like protein
MIGWTLYPAHEDFPQVLPMTTSSFHSNVWNFVNRGAQSDDSDEIRLKKAILTLISSGIALLAVFWGCLYICSGYPYSGAIPLSYAGISFFSIAHFFKTKKFAAFRFSQLLMILLLPFLLMWSLGGFANSSVVMIWAFFAPLAALFFSGLKSASRWLLAFIALTIISGLINEQLAFMARPMNESLNTVYFIMNMGAGFLLIYIVLHYFVKDRQASHVMAVQSKEQAIQSKAQLQAAYEQLKQNEIKIRELMLTDPLTGIANRRYLDQRLEHEIQRSLRYGTSFSIIMTDLDHFKQINDKYGHNTGDAVLVQFAKVLNANVRSSDFVARYGGEEFVILLPDTDNKGAVELAERIRQDTAQQTFQDVRQPVTASFGVTTVMRAQDGVEVLKKADEALYSSKEQGRNRVTFKK